MTIQEDFPLAPLTSFKIGGPARYYCHCQTIADVTAALAYARKTSLPWFILGGGTNLLVADRGYQGLVIHLAGLKTLGWALKDERPLLPGQQRVRAGAGLAIAGLALEAAKAGLAGLEFAGGLPGSLGGAAFMNARAYGGEISEIVEGIRVLTPAGKLAYRAREELAYGYKTSALMENREIILELDLLLRPASSASLVETTKANQEKRRAQGQYLYPNAGCVFKNNYDCGIPSGRLIDQAGLKGLRVGGAEVFEQHGNFIVNRDQASAEDVRELISKVKQGVLETHGIALAEEVRYLGFEN